MLGRNITGTNSSNITVETPNVSVFQIETGRLDSLEAQDVLHTNELNSHNTRLVTAESLLSNSFDQSSILGDVLQENNFTKSVINGTLTVLDSSVFQDSIIGNISQNNSSIIQTNDPLIWNQFGNSVFSRLEIQDEIVLPANVVLPGSLHNEDLVLSENATIQQSTSGIEVNTLTSTDYFGEIRLSGNFSQIGAGDTTSLKNVTITGNCTLPAFSSPTINSLQSDISSNSTEITNIQNNKANIDSPEFINGGYFGSTNQLKIDHETTDSLAGRMIFEKLYLKNSVNDTMCIFSPSNVRFFKELLVYSNATIDQNLTINGVFSCPTITNIENNKADKSYVDSQDTNLQNQIITLQDKTQNITTATVGQTNFVGDIHLPISKNLYIGDTNNRLRMHHSGIDSYIDYNNKLYYRSGGNTMFMTSSGVSIYPTVTCNDNLDVVNNISCNNLDVNNKITCDRITVKPVNSQYASIFFDNDVDDNNSNYLRISHAHQSDTSVIDYSSRLLIRTGVQASLQNVMDLQSTNVTFKKDTIIETGSTFTSDITTDHENRINTMENARFVSGWYAISTSLSVIGSLTKAELNAAGLYAYNIDKPFSIKYFLRKSGSPSSYLADETFIEISPAQNRGDIGIFVQHQFDGLDNFTLKIKCATSYIFSGYNFESNSFEEWSDALLRFVIF